MKTAIITMTIFYTGILFSEDYDATMASSWEKQQLKLEPQIIHSKWVKNDDAWTIYSIEYFRHETNLRILTNGAGEDLDWIRHINLLPSDLLLRRFADNGIILDANSIFQGKMYFVQNPNPPEHEAEVYGLTPILNFTTGSE